MLSYVARRLLYMIPVLLGVALLVFFLFNTVGEDPVRLALGNHASAQAYADLRHKWGLDQSLPLQFLGFLKQIVTFDYGVPFITGEPLSDVLRAGAGVSLLLTIPPFVFGFVLNVALALVIAYYRGTWLDRISTGLFIMAMSISYLVYIIALQYALAFKLDWFPINGYAPGAEGLKYFVLPWLIIIIVSIGPDVRLIRTMFLDETQADYVRTARAKG